MITYSKLILFLKLAFFAAALFILGFLFIVSPPDKFGEPVRVSTLGLEKNIAYHILGANLRGATAEGHRFDFKVDSIDPYNRNPEVISLTNLNGILSIFKKDVYNISANKALINSTENFVDLIGDLNIKTSSGIAGKSQKIRIDWSSIDIIVSSEVELTTPIGTIFSETMKISKSLLSDETSPIIHFEKDVRLVFRPNTKLKVQ